ncbi:hypothetical protein EDC61_10670 [Sulfuritortus calidifontis]|uniref:NurA domain-containing protein n=1 Tax=Sulfuritortus calidifontis TaxID=1914471 RepID=A0A4V6NYR6_9PROT|nr:hypothetical protein [Sulfuritortus calidifontis]TCS72155.1 hypothetical protein EDC61_10670 [Sulfuritortus calidifontis]
MPSETSVVLPDSLVSDLVNRIGSLTDALQKETTLLYERRDEIRDHMKNAPGALKLGTLPGHSFPVTVEPDLPIHAIDGAHVAKADRGAAYSLSCVVGLSPSGIISRQRACTAVMPHFMGLSSISGGLMTMQEIMMAVELAEGSPSALVLIDGSRLSAFISINQFYEAILKDGLDALREWRRQAAMGANEGPSATLAEFEARDWLTPFLTLPNIIGNLKLVTTKGLIKRYAPDLLHRFDDQAVANTVLELGEGTMIRFDHADQNGQKLPPLHITNGEQAAKGEGYPFSAQAAKAGELLHTKGLAQLAQLYARINPMHGVYKIEFNHGFLAQTLFGVSGKALLAKLIEWWGWNTAAVDIMEPYPAFVADRFVSEAVKVSELALRDILVRKSETDLLWNLGRPYRS